MKTSLKLTTAAAVACLAATTMAAQQPAATAPAGSFAAGAATAPLTAKIPIDPQISTGQFANGLRYYIRTNKKPEKRAELRLVVNAGSILEERDQSGLAHFVEHMDANRQRPGTNRLRPRRARRSDAQGTVVRRNAARRLRVVQRRRSLGAFLVESA